MLGGLGPGGGASGGVGGRQAYGGRGSGPKEAPAGAAGGGSEFSDAPATSTEHDFDDDIPF